MESIGSPALWGGFVAFVFAMLALDLGVFHRKSHAVAPREALVWSAVWIGLALLFNAFVAWRFGAQFGIEFLTGYLIEKSLSVDNIFVFLVIFSGLGIPLQYQHRVLFWGILSALVLRALMIFAGAALLERFHGLIYLFGAFLVFTGVKLFLDRGKEEHPERSPLMRWAQRWIPSTPRLHGDRFWVLENGRRVATPLFMALLMVEITDVIFAIDSIPAIFAVTRDPFIVFTSNIFAILGLRSLFFLLADLMDRFVYLKVGLSAVLIFVGGKMALIDFVKIPPPVSLAVVLSLLGGAVLASWWKTRRSSPRPPAVPGAGAQTSSLEP